MLCALPNSTPTTLVNLDKISDRSPTSHHMYVKLILVKNWFNKTIEAKHQFQRQNFQIRINLRSKINYFLKKKIQNQFCSRTFKYVKANYMLYIRF